MAIAFRAVATNRVTTAAANTATIPATVQPGDLLLAVHSQVNALNNPADPAGWTRVGQTDDGTTGRVTVWQRIAQAGDAGATVTADPSATSLLAVAAWSGVDGTTPVVAQASANEGSTTANHTMPTVTNTAAGAWHVAMLYDRGSSAAGSQSNGFTPPAGLTERLDYHDSSAQTFPIGFGIADSNAVVATGTVGGGTYAADVAHNPGVMWTLVLGPAVTSTVTGTLAGTLPGAAAATAGQAQAAGAVTADLPPAQAAAAGAATATGSATLALPPAAAATGGQATASGAVTAALPPLTAGASGQATATAAANATLPALGVSASAQVTVTGGFAHDLPPLTAALAAQRETAGGTFNNPLPALTATAAGQVTAAGTTAADLPPVAAAMAGGLEGQALLEATLPTVAAALNVAVETGQVGYRVGALTGPGLRRHAPTAGRTQAQPAGPAGLRALTVAVTGRQSAGPSRADRDLTGPGRATDRTTGPARPLVVTGPEV